MHSKKKPSTNGNTSENPRGATRGFSCLIIYDADQTIRLITVTLCQAIYKCNMQPHLPQQKLQKKPATPTATPPSCTSVGDGNRSIITQYVSKIYTMRHLFLNITLSHTLILFSSHKAPHKSRWHILSYTCSPIQIRMRHCQSLLRP